MNVLLLFKHEGYNETVVVVDSLPVPAVYIGCDEWVDYWRGVDGYLYGTY